MIYLSQVSSSKGAIQRVEIECVLFIRKRKSERIACSSVSIRNLDLGHGRLRCSKTTLLISEVFPESKACHDHEIGPRLRNIYCLVYLRDMLVYLDDIYRHYVLHSKFRTMLGKEVALTSQHKIPASSAV